MEKSIPTNKLRPFDTTKTNVVIFAGGSFCPIHNGHVNNSRFALTYIKMRIVDEARKYLMENNYNVLGAYLCPRVHSRVS